MGLDVSPAHSGLVVIDDVGSVSFFEHFDSRDKGVKTDFNLRVGMAEALFSRVKTLQPHIIGLEDYDLSGTQQVAYQIAETSGTLKYLITRETNLSLLLIAIRKLKSYVLKKRDVPKDAVIDWANQNGFDIPVKKRGKVGGFDKTQRGDLADAFVLAVMAKEFAYYSRDGHAPEKGHIFLDPDYGLAYRPDLLLGSQPLEVR